MALKILWTLSAQQDRVKVFKYWNKRTKSREYSQKLNKLIQHRISLIKDYPTSGLVTNRIGIRYHLIDRHYKLFYKIDDDIAYIMRFWDTRQDPDKLDLKNRT